MTAIDPIPPGPRLVPYLAVDDATAALKFYVDVLGMQEQNRIPMDDGRIGHAELALGNAQLFLSDEFPEIGVIGPKQCGGSPVSLLLYVRDVDAVVERVLAAGGSQEGETKDEVFGARTAKVRDPFGHRWFLHTRTQ
ncbi:MAG: VOC family protein [Nannocystaceae bacterium]|nr:VOC family protein [Nannocystaceae bacterium]